MTSVTGLNSGVFGAAGNTNLAALKRGVSQDMARLQAVLDTRSARASNAAAGSAQTSAVAPQTLFAVQSMAQETQDITAVSSVDNSPRAQFLKYQEMDSADKYRAMLLGEMGMTEEELAALPPEEREKIEEKIRERIKELIEEDLRQQQQKQQRESLIP